MTNTTSTTSSSTDVAQKLRVIEVKPGLKFGLGVLQEILPDVETALFFGKVYELDGAQMGNLLSTVLNTTLAKALFGESSNHSHDLQDYMVDLASFVPAAQRGDITTEKRPPAGEILPHLWAQLEIEVADSIKAVAAKLKDVVGLMPGKQGSMVFRTMATLNKRRPTIGVHKAAIHHAPKKPNLVILDDSGSVSTDTVLTIIEDVIAMAYMADAHFALVSSSVRHWAPGAYGVDVVSQAVEGGGTNYENLRDLLNQDWGVVVSIADYDSSRSAKATLAQCTGNVDELVDISLVNTPTYLAECVGQRATRVRPLLVAAGHGQLSA